MTFLNHEAKVSKTVHTDKDQYRFVFVIENNETTTTTTKNKQKNTRRNIISPSIISNDTGRRQSYSAV